MGKFVDLTGMRFCQWEVLEPYEKSSDGKRRWLCKCDCGNVAPVYERNLLKGLSKRCRPCANKIPPRTGPREDLTGLKFGRWTVIELCDFKSNDGKLLWKCVCECGNIGYVATSLLKSGASRSCGCLVKDVMSKTKKTHGMSNNKLYNIWRGMLARCYNKSHTSFKFYGARGITVCEEWRNSFEAFMEWAIKNGFDEKIKDQSIDRIDPNGNYYPDNCRWATCKEQSNNKRTNLFITIEGVTKTVAEWSAVYNISRYAVYGRIKRGWREEDLFLPTDPAYKHASKKQKEMQIKNGG